MIGHNLTIYGGEAESEYEKEMADALRIARERNHHLVQFMRNFADVVRLPSPRKESVHLQGLVEQAARLMHYKAKMKNITFDFELLDVPVFVEADPHQLEHVLINIIKNGIEAMDEGGVIRFIITGVTDSSPILLQIVDSGSGIRDEDEERLFSPFFSAKKDGQGVGLTLTREILSNHGFGFSLKNVDVGRGAVFSIGFC